MAAHSDSRSIFDLCPNDDAFIGLREVNTTLKQATTADPTLSKLEDESPEDETPLGYCLVRGVSDKKVCSTCRCPFNNREEQVEHYKLDWHRFNLRRKMSGIPLLTAEEFERKTGAGDLSSISGSESDSEEEDLAVGSGESRCNRDDPVESSLIAGWPSSKVVFQNSTGQYLTVYRCILQGKAVDEQDVGSSLKAISKKTIWVILMTGGGHFAGAVFQGKDVLQHKTFHRYTVRAKRGTAQGLRDSQNGSHTPKSAGAALRRHNEAALVQDIQDLLASWADQLKEASVIFVRAPSYNKTIFFGGRAAPFDKKDPRIRTLPIVTRRATFRETQRVHEVLSTIHVYGKDTDMSAIFCPSKKSWKKTVKPTAQTKTDPEKEEAEETHNSSEKEEVEDIQLEMVELTLGTLDLREFEISTSRHRRKRRGKKEETKIQNEEPSNTEAHNHEEEMPEATAEVFPNHERQSKTRKRKAQNKKENLEEVADESWEYGLLDSLFTACKVGDVEAVRKLLQLPGEMAENHEQSEIDAPNPLILLNKAMDSSGLTLLHVASAAAQKAVVRLLLATGADPACRDKKGQTPYIVAPDKDTRNVFRKYMGENPDKYDYKAAQVPGPLTAEIETKQSEKKKAQKALRKQREKEQKEEKRKQELEVEEKKRFASLTDREKRALAAEKRLAQQVAATGVSLTNVKRCWMCGESLLGKIPFHYLEYSFCTPRCVQAHRKANTLPGKT